MLYLYGSVCMTEIAREKRTRGPITRDCEYHVVVGIKLMTSGRAVGASNIEPPSHHPLHFLIKVNWDVYPKLLRVEPALILKDTV